MNPAPAQRSRAPAGGAIASLKHAAPWLIAELGAPHMVASWAVVRGGLSRADRVAWLQVRDAELGPGVDPEALLKARLRAAGLPEAVGLLTSCSLRHFTRARCVVDGVSAEAVATVGLSNRLAVGDRPTPPAVGTINVLVVLGQPAREPALLEALSIAVEGRTAAVSALGLSSVVSARLATGTGTDCVVVAAPVGGPPPLKWAGKHTAIGAAVGEATRRAVAEGGRAWVERRS